MPSAFNIYCKQTRAGPSPTEWDDKEPHVAEPVWGLWGEVVYEQPQNRVEVVLRSGHHDLYGNGRLGVTVAAATENKG